MSKTKYLLEERERAVRLARDHPDEYGSQWAAIESIAGKIGCSAQTLCNADAVQLGAAVGSSMHRNRTRCGGATSRMPRPGLDSFTWPS